MGVTNLKDSALLFKINPLFLHRLFEIVDRHNAKLVPSLHMMQWACLFHRSRVSRRKGYLYKRRCYTKNESLKGILDRANVNIGSIQRILGHGNRSTTEIYLHSIGESEREAMRIFEWVSENSHINSHTNSHTETKKEVSQYR